MSGLDTPELVWSHRGNTLLGRGGEQFDPGTGEDRYQRAREWLDSTGAEVGFASFTFDPDEPGSIALAPAEAAWSTDWPPASKDSDVGGECLDDGVGAWDRGFAAAMAELEAGKVDKVVLTRQTVWRLDEPVHSVAVAAGLARQQGNAFVFAVEGLVGASPELLVSFRGGEIRSLALAGTARSAEELETTAIGAEHQFAAESVESSLSQHVTGLRKQRDVLEFGDIFHLATEFTGVAKPGATVLDILSALHPTAAVAGAPTKAAVDLISEIEPVSRRRYAGPVGWFDRDGDGEFAIALRCGLLDDERVTLYAGGGLVVGCERDRELAETDLKMVPMQRALGLQPGKRF